MRRGWFWVLVVSVGVRAARGQDSRGYFVPRHAWVGFAEYSNDSSHMVLRESENRKLGALGGGYAVRLLRTRVFAWQWMVEVRPVMAESDPEAYRTVVPGPGSGDSATFAVLSLQRASDCAAMNEVVDLPNPVTGQPSTVAVTETCGRRWTYAAGLSPLGQKISFLPKRRVQVFAVGNAGFLVGTHPIPDQTARRFNFTFEFGAGVEWFRGTDRSWALQYRVHHLSNDFTAASNPGVDSGVVMVMYGFGR